jgi:hypothetical protein
VPPHPAARGGAWPGSSLRHLSPREGSTARRPKPKCRRSRKVHISDCEKCTAEREVARRAIGQGGSLRRAKADGRRRVPLNARPTSPRKGRKVLQRWRRRPEGGQTSVGRRKAPTNFGPPRCGLCVMKLCPPGPSSASSSYQTQPDGVSPNTEGGQTAHGRWNRPTNFGHLIGDLLDMSTVTTRPWWQSSVPIGGELWPPPHASAAAIEELCS